MLSVELLPCPFCGVTPKPFSHPQYAPVEVTCDDEECAAFNIVVSLESWNKRAVPATHHKVEPLMIQAVAVTRDDDDEGLVLEWLLEGGISEMEFAGMTLFALPEANELCDEEGSAEIYLSPQSVEPPDPVPVMMPERETYTKYLVGVIPNNANEVNAYKDGWNTCLEEVVRLNGIKL